MLRLKFWRLRAGLTQAEAASRLAVGESTLALLESGRLRPSTIQRERLRSVFGDDAERLFDEVRDDFEPALR